MAFILALDQGTTSSRAILFDHAGAIRAVRKRSLRSTFRRRAGLSMTRWRYGPARSRSPGPRWPVQNYERQT